MALPSSVAHACSMSGPRSFPLQLCCLVCLAAAEPPLLILDTDIASDCDDAGAVAMLNALADRDEVRILGMMVSTGGRFGAPALSSINAWYGREVPIATLDDGRFWVGGGPDRPAGAQNYESYNRVLAETRPGSLRPGAAPEATTTYRRLLAAQTDASVTVCSLGPLINLHRLLDSAPDQASPLSGTELVRAKVVRLVVAGGRNPEGTSSNFSKSGAGTHAEAVIARWPSAMVFVGNEIGGTVLSGWHDGPVEAENPARLAYRLFHAGDGARKRASWDQAAVLFAVRGCGGHFQMTSGRQTCDAQGRNRWDASGAGHACLVKLEGADPRLAADVEQLMNQPAYGAAARLGRRPVRLILDMDMDSDCDDAGALVVLHALADRGEVEPLAVMTSSLNPWSGPCIDAINTWAGRAGLPIGSARAPAPDQASRYAKGVADRLPHRLAASRDAPEAVGLYMQVLAAAADSSITIVTVGDMTNLAKLLREPGGMELVRRKVAVWLCMGGNFIGRPAHDDLKLSNNNFTLDPAATLAAITGWPTPIVFAGREMCSVPSGVQVGAALADAPADHPARIAYELYHGGQPKNRHVADLVAVLAAVRGPGDLWDAEGQGRMDLLPDMTFTWRYDRNAHAYLRKRASDPTVEAALQELLLHVPKR